MKWFSVSVMSWMIAGGAMAADATAVVRFANRDQLSGSMESLSTSRLVWNSPILEKPTSFFLKDVLDLSLPAEGQESRARHEATVNLTNGDNVRGQLTGVAEDGVELETSFGGKLRFRREMISEIRVDERPDYVYQGPKGLDGWKQTDTPPSWSYRDASLVSSSAGGIARVVDLPDECSVTFDAEWRDAFVLKVILFSDNIETDGPGNGYDLNFQQRAIYLRNCQSGKSLGRGANAFALQENEKARIEIRASIKSGKVCVFVDGRIIEVWTDPDVAANKVGRGLHFVTVNASPVRISRIGVSHWDGQIEQMPEPVAMGGFRQFGLQDMDEPLPVAPVEAPKEGRMMLRNGDSIAGEVTAIDADLITIKTTFKEVRLPIESLHSIALKAAPREVSKREAGDVRGWLPDGSSLVFRLEEVSGGELVGYNQNFGTARFKMNAFSRIEFNIYDMKLDDLRGPRGW